MASTTAPLPPEVVPGPNRDDGGDPSLRLPGNLTKDVRTWIEWLGKLMGKIEPQDGAPSQPELTKDGEPIKPARDDVGTLAHTAASGMNDAPRRMRSETGLMSPPVNRQSQSNTLLTPPGQTDASIDAEEGKKRDGVRVTAYYDSYVHWFFDEIVRSVKTSRGMLRKAKMAKGGAKDTLRFSRTRPKRTPDDKQPDVYDNLDKGLEGVESECERAAHEFLWGGGADIEKIRRRLQDLQSLLKDTERADGEGGTMGSARPPGSGQRAQTAALGTAMVHDRAGLRWQPSNPLLVHGNATYYIGKKIGEGSFGVVFEGTRTDASSSRRVAIKFERRKTGTPQLRDEYRTYKRLAGCPGVPSVYYFDQLYFHNILVLDLLGPSLEDLFQGCGRRFSIKTVVMLGKQMLSIVQELHERHMIHCDIKPENFLMTQERVSLVDFGMAKEYRNCKTKEHIPYREDKTLCGTARYISINMHLQREQSRRDDLEALGHVFLYFLRGRLPWQGVKGVDRETKYERIGKRKQSVGVKELCKEFPVQFGEYLTYVRGLNFEDAPDYEYLRGLFTQALKDAGGVEDGEFDWMNVGKGTLQLSASGDTAPGSSGPPLEGQSRLPVVMDANGQDRKRSGTHSVLRLGQDRFEIRHLVSGPRGLGAGRQAAAGPSIVAVDRDSGETRDQPLQALQQYTGQYRVLTEPPPMADAWVQYERDAGPRPTYDSPLEKQSEYAKECRKLHQMMMAPGARDYHLSEDITICRFTVASERDGFLIPVHQYRLVRGDSSGNLNETVVVYYHGGGLKIGEADSEDLSCRRILKESGLCNVTLYSVGYRLMPQVKAAVCLSDSLDAFNHLHHLHRHAEFLVVGSSSGGQLAALVSQTVPRGTIAGVVLRCPVTSDVPSGRQYIPKWLRPLHTTWIASFETSLLGGMKREIPRDGLERMPLEAPRDDLRGLPPHWIQVCTNDKLYSDGMCYAVALEDAGVEVKLKVEQGWPHTFWLVAPQLQEALNAERAMLEGITWVA